MIYRVILEFSVYKLAFDFLNVEAAGDIARTLYAHMSREGVQPKIRIEVVGEKEEEPQDD